MDNWLKFRNRTPLMGGRTPTVPPTPSFDNGANFGHDIENESRLRPASKVPSGLNFGKHSTSATDSSSFPSPSFSFDSHTLECRAAHDVWQNPTPDQIAETLKVAMMKRGNFEPVPVEYNSNILHVLEAYWIQSRELKKRDQELSELRAKLNQQMDQVELLGKEWSTKEGQYKIELKKLEVMVANGVTGLEAVTLARSHSVLDRSNSEIEERIRQIREGSDHSNAGRRKMMTSSSSTQDKEVKLSKMFRERRHRRTERRIRERLSSSSDDNESAEKKPYISSALPPNNESKPVPDIPQTVSNAASHDEEESSQKDPVKSKASDSRNRHFSYVPGDDSFQWRRQHPDAVTGKSALGSSAQQSTLSTGSSGTASPNDGSTQKSSASTSLFSSSNQPQLLAKHLELRDLPKRWDSNSSVVTAIQDKPSRNNSDKESSSGGGKKPDAAVAAVRAMAAGGQGGS